MGTAIIISIVIFTMVLLAVAGVLARAKARENEEEAKQKTLREAKARSDRFQRYVSDDLDRTSRVSSSTPVIITPPLPAAKPSPKKTPVKRREEASGAAYEVPDYGFASYDSYSDSGSSSSSYGSSSSYDSGSSSSSSYDSGSSSSSSDSGSSW